MDLTASGEVVQKEGSFFLRTDEKQELPLSQNDLLAGTGSGKTRGRFRVARAKDQTFKLELIELLE